MLKTGLIFLAAWLALCPGADSDAAESNSVASSSTGFVVEHLDIGLPSSAVISMTQTRDGYLWLGTLKGLVRFDGVHVKVFDDNNTPGLNGSVIVHLFEDSRTNLWVGTESAGIAVIKEGRIIATDMGTGASERRLASTCEDASGAVWFYAANGELWRFAGGRADHFAVAPGVPSACRSIIAEKSGPVWIGTDDKLRAVNPTAMSQPGELPIEEITPVDKLDFLLAARRGGYWRLADHRVQFWRTNQLVRDLGPYPWASNALVSAACEDNDGNLIVGTLTVNDGVYWFGPDGNATRISHTEGLSHDGILSLCVDHEGSLWVGTDGGGLNRVKKSFCEILEGSESATMQSVCADNEGGLWIGWGGGARYWKEGLSQQFILNLLGRKVNVSSVFVDRAQKVWAGTREGGLFQWQGKEFTPVSGMAGMGLQVFCIYQDRDGHLWIGTQAGLARWNESEWTMFTTSDGLSANTVRAIAEDATGNLWIGTEGGGLNRLRDGKFTVFHKADGLPGEKISSLWRDNENALWVGTDGGGLARWQNGKWTRYTKEHGLASNSITYVIDDDHDGLWLGSNSGLMRVPKSALNDFTNHAANAIPCRTYGKADGLPTLECSQGFQPAATRTLDGKLWFATIKGLVSVNPATLKPNPHTPPVMIESVLIDGQEQNTNSLLSGWLKRVVIPPRKERLEIHYTSLNLAAADRARFRYRMEGHESAWFEAGDLRVAAYPKLPPGDYHFHVTACNEDGVWNEAGATLAVVVRPAFWQTWWFRSLVAASLIGLVAGAVYYVSTQRLQRQLALLKQKEALEKERARIARDLHDHLGANLTQVALLGEMVESDKHLPAEIEIHARQISDTARETTASLDEIVWAANPANDTLDSLVTYACKYAQDYLAVAGLRYRLEVPEHLPATPIPPDIRHNVFLAFKEAVNNVVKHAQATSVQVRIRLGLEHFILEIEDDGRGIGDAGQKTHRNGLRNMRKRMEDVRGEFFIGPAGERGTLIRLTAPLGGH